MKGFGFVFDLVEVEGVGGKKRGRGIWVGALKKTEWRRRRNRGKKGRKGGRIRKIFFFLFFFLSFGSAFFLCSQICLSLSSSFFLQI